MIFSESEKLLRLIIKSAQMQTLKKLVLSKPTDKSIVKCVITPKLISGKQVLQAESFYSDNKARQKNIAIDDIEAQLFDVTKEYSQINLITSAGDCEYKVSKSGNATLIGGDKLDRAMSDEKKEFARIVPTANNKKKNHILQGDEQFLIHLGVSDKNGRVYDKKQAKFRQINRFLELIRDIEDKLPSGKLRICDLCCGKSYLSFAVYHYFAVIKGREVKMTGADLKPDVMEYCADVAKKCGFDGLEFICTDIGLYDALEHVNMVISLHACDTATDFVLSKAIDWEADVILSTPCCHHEMNRLLDCRELDFIGRHSMLRQKLADAATDALRLTLLEANGYDAVSLELIDPEETPKNIMLRGVKKPNFDKNGKAAREARERYREAHLFLTGKEPTRL